MADFLSDEIRRQFPVLAPGAHEAPLVYLDSAATALTPQCVIEAVSSYYRSNSCNIHRGLYRLSEEATEIYEGARENAARFLSASSPDEIIFTHGATESVNLVSYSLSERIGPDDRIVASGMEHHANLVPWQQAAARTGAKLDVLPVDPQTGTIREEDIRRCITEDTAIVAVSGMSNVTGVGPPVERIVGRAREVGAQVLLDAAQLAAHEAIDVKALDVDFLAFSGHKLYGPTGIGVLYARSGSLADAPPFLTGGDMIERVALSGSSFRRPPGRFEAGTPHIAGAAGLSAALDFITSTGWDTIRERERRCTSILMEILGGFEEVEIYSPDAPSLRSSVVSFNIRGVHPHDTAGLLGEREIAVRAGLHCAQPYVESLGTGTSGTVRASLGVYSTEEDIEALREGIKEVISVFG